MQYEMVPHVPGALLDPPLATRHLKSRPAAAAAPTPPVAPPSREQVLARIKAKQEEAKAAKAAAAGAAAAAPLAAEALSAETLSCRTVKELKAAAAAQGLSTAGCAEKSDLVALLMQAQGNSTVRSGTSSGGLKGVGHAGDGSGSGLDEGEDGYVAPSAAAVLAEAEEAAPRAKAGGEAGAAAEEDLVPDDYRGPLAHAGFVAAARAVAREVAAAVAASALEPRASDACSGRSAAVGVKAVSVCGHSLGGALATLLALELHHLVLAHKLFGDEAAPPVPVAVTTFGAPHVGNQALAACLAGAGGGPGALLACTRVVLRNDPVPRLLSSGLHRHAAPYAHHPAAPVSDGSGGEGGGGKVGGRWG